MKTEEFLDVMNELPNDLILDAGAAREKTVPRRRRVLRTALLAAVLTLLLSVTAYAAGGFTGYIFTTGRGVTWTSVDKLPRAERKLGLRLSVPESFSNGFSFREMTLLDTSRINDEGQVTETYPELSASYQTSGAVCSLFVSGERPEPHGAGAAARECGGVTAWGRSQDYKAVPEGYELTEEDNARRASGELTISWGSDSVKEFTLTSVQFTLGGADYLLMSMEGLPTDELFAMAEEIILAGKA